MLKPSDFSAYQLRELVAANQGSYRAAVRAVGGEWTGTWQRAMKLAHEEASEEEWFDSICPDEPSAEITNLKRPPDGWEADLFEQACAYGETIHRLEIEQYEADISIDTQLPIGIAITSDQHLGNEGTDHRLLGKIIDTIVDTPGLFVCDNGDSIDNFVALSHETGRYEQIIRPRYQKQLARWIWGRWAPKLLACTGGQHEYFETRVSDFDTAEYLSRKGDAVFLGPGGKLNLQVGEQPYSIGMWHKFQGNSMYSATAAAMRLFREHGPFDISITGDKHEPAINYQREQGRWGVFVRAGTFKIRDSYGRSLGFETANPLDYVAVPLTILWPGERKFFITLDFFGGIEYLAFLREHKGDSDGD